MDEKTTALCESFIANRDIIKKVFRGESTYIIPVAANALVAHGVTADLEKLKLCKKIIKKKSGVLSYLKENVMVPFAATLSMKEDPMAHFEKVAKFYSVTKKQFNRSDYSALLAIMLADLVDEEKFDSVIKRGKHLYSMMEEKHPFLTNNHDSVLVGLLALSPKNNIDLIDDMEKCYDLLKIKFSHKSRINGVSHVLALTSGNAHEKVDHLIELYDALKEAGKKIGVYTDLSTLAAVSILDNDVEKLRDTIIEIDGFLAKQKGYGMLGLDKKTRLLHATLLTTDLYDTAQAAQNTSTASALAMSAAQQIAICIVIDSVLAAASMSYSE